MIKEKNCIVTKEELVDILYQLNNDRRSRYQKIKSKSEISDVIDYIVSLEEEDNKIYKYQDLIDLISQGRINKDYNGLDFSINFQNVYFFKLDDDKYIYLYPNINLKSVETEKDMISQLDYVINNHLYPKKYEDYLFFLKKQSEEDINMQKEQEKTVKEEFKEYDYIKIISDNFKYDDIGIKDIKKCINYIGYDSNIKKILTLNEEVSLYLIVLFGVRNIYLNTSSYYKERYRKYINSIIENLERYIEYIKDNKKKIVNETKYSFNHDCYLNLYEYLNNSINYDPDYKIIEGKTFTCLSKSLKLILFEYYISNCKYEKAKEIYENSIKYYLKLADRIPYNSLFKFWLVDLDIFEVEEINDSYDFFEKHKLKPLIKRNIEILLRFYICAYYYYKHIKDDENADNVYKFLLYFRKGFGIEDFIVKLKYYKMADELLKIKTDNLDDIDKTVEEINNKIKELIKVDQFDVENVALDYVNINFDNLDKRVKRYIATGDKIVRTFDNQNEEFDYSCAVIEWSKAVELEINNKFMSKISYEKKRAIEEYSKEKNPNQKFDFRLDTKNATIGFYDAIQKYNLQDYLYDNYFSNMYTFDKKTYNKLCQYMRDIHETRNDSAHKEKSIKYETAQECKDKIVKSNMILEIMSKLEEKNTNN